MGKVKLAILASGSGSNAEAIANYFQESTKVQVDIILSNKKNAYVLERAKKLGIPSDTFSRADIYDTHRVMNLLFDRAIDYIILAGFLWLIPTDLISAYRNKIINIHPSILPKHGGKGMYGGKVHQSVIDAKEKESGITIHLVDEIYDNGRVLRQEKVEVLPEDTPDTLASKIHKLEHEFFPKTIESYVLNNI